MNEHAIQALDRYVDGDPHSVPHAVLIQGPWGSGKTYFLEKIYEPRRQELGKQNNEYRAKLLIVSLFGATSALDVEARMHRAANPTAAVVGRAVSTVGTGISEFFKVKDAFARARNWAAKKAFRRPTDQIIVLDDLERVQAGTGALGEIMGLVNTYITTYGRRVILVTDEEQLEKLHQDFNWADQNEKIIGRRVRIEADTESVTRSCVSEISNQAARSFMEGKIDDLIFFANQSKIENLRNLAWGVHNAAAFVGCLLTDEEISSEHVARTMSFVLVTTMWHRSRKLDEAVMEKLPNLTVTLVANNINNRRDPQPEDPLIKRASEFAETFNTLRVDRPPVGYEMFVDLEKLGVLDCAAVIEWVKSQFGFGKDYVEPAWRTIWYSHERLLDQVETAIVTLATELADRRHRHRGPILHAAGLAVKLRDANDTRLTGGEEVVAFFKRYIDDLADTGILERASLDPWPIDLDAFDGLGFSSKESEEFQEIYHYMHKRQREVAEGQLKATAEAMIERAEGGDIEVLRELARSSGDEISQQPVLKDIPVERIVALFTRDNLTLNAGREILAYRYLHTHNDSPLLAEIEWARKVYTGVLAKLDTWDDPHRSMAKASWVGIIRHYDRERIPQARVILNVAEDVLATDAVGEDEA